MKILKIRDCEVSDPPSTCFAVLPETESDRAFVAELVDLPTANRVVEVVRDPALLAVVMARATTARVAIQSLGGFLESTPNGGERYTDEILAVCLEEFQVYEETLLKSAFMFRMFHF